VIAYWGMGLYWGKASSNNKKGHMIGHIKDIGHDPSSPLTRLYATHAAQPFHNDSAGVSWEAEHARFCPAIIVTLLYLLYLHIVGEGDHTSTLETQSLLAACSRTKYAKCLLPFPLTIFCFAGIVTLLCLRNARAGGLAAGASSAVCSL
jgi:hypothetical protein